MPRKPSRGVRNNNPGNIDRNATKWQGMAADQSGDPRFVVFKSPEFGIRALAKTLMTYQTQHKLNTIRKIINRWAPPVENDTSAYVDAVANACGVWPDEKIDVDQAAIMFPLVKAIIRHENGYDPYSDDKIKEGIRLAGVHDVPAKPMVKQTAVVTQAATAVSVACAGVAEWSGPVKKAADQLVPFAGAPFIERVQTVLLTAAGCFAIAGIVSLWLKQKATT